MPANHSSFKRSADHAAHTWHVESPWADWATDRARREAAPNGHEAAQSAAPRDELDTPTRKALMDCYNG
jgi:hypothetical protein